MTSTPSLPFAGMVGSRMKDRGVGLRQLCRAVDLDPSFFSKVLAGKRNPPSEEAVLRRIAGELGLDAPRLIVAAGRIPGEWSRLWDDQDLFESVHAIAAGDAPAVPGSVGAKGRPAWRRRDPEPVRPVPRPPDDFGTELL